MKWNSERKKLERVHRAKWESHYGPIPEGLVIRHKCDNPSCFNIDHLEIGTQADNVRDMVERGRSRGGKRSAELRMKLSDEEFEEALRAHNK